MPPAPVQARRPQGPHCTPLHPTAPHCREPLRSAAHALPQPLLCLSFSGLAGFARLCPGDQYEVRLRRFMVCLRPKEWQISAGFYIVVNKAFLHQHPEKQLLFFLYMLWKTLEFSSCLPRSGHLSEDLKIIFKALDYGYSKNYVPFFFNFNFKKLNLTHTPDPQAKPPYFLSVSQNKGVLLMSYSWQTFLIPLEKSICPIPCTQNKLNKSLQASFTECLDFYFIIKQSSRKTQNNHFLRPRCYLLGGCISTSGHCSIPVENIKSSLIRDGLK